jgi:K+-sensing histidine kinase KdpD
MPGRANPLPCVVTGNFLSISRDLLALLYLKGWWLGKPMRALNGGVSSIVVSVGLILAVTAILWQVNLTTGGSHNLVYVYLFPVTLIAALYNGRLALLGTGTALICAAYFLQEPLYSLAIDNPLERGDLFVFALLAVTAIKFIRVLVRPRTSLGPKSRSA